MINALVLAAGKSRRMGVQKLLLPLRGKPLVAQVVDVLLGSPVEQVYVVIGGDGIRILDALENRPVRAVTNPHPESEMLDSVRCGLRAMPETTDAVLVALGDQPALDAKVVARIVEAHQRTGSGLVVPAYQGRRGHPLLLSWRYRNEIMNRFDGQGLRGLLAAHAPDVLELQVDNAGILEDIDLPEDYRRALGNER